GHSSDNIAATATSRKYRPRWIRNRSAGITVISAWFCDHAGRIEVRPAGVSRIALSYAHAGATRLRLDRFSGSFSHYDGFALILFGLALLALSLGRFIRTSPMIDDKQSHSPGG